MSVFGTLFPSQNRTAAGVAFIRTAWQTIKATSIVGVGAGVIVTAGDLLVVDWQTVGLTVAGIGITATLAASSSAIDILVHGLPEAYTAPAGDHAA